MSLLQLQDREQVLHHTGPVSDGRLRVWTRAGGFVGVAASEQVDRDRLVVLRAAQRAPLPRLGVVGLVHARRELGRLAPRSGAEAEVAVALLRTNATHQLVRRPLDVVSSFGPHSVVFVGTAAKLEMA